MSVFDVFLFQKLFDLYDYLVLLLCMTLNFSGTQEERRPSIDKLLGCSIFQRFQTDSDTSWVPSFLWFGQFTEHLTFSMQQEGTAISNLQYVQECVQAEPGIPCCLTPPLGAKEISSVFAQGIIKHYYMATIHMLWMAVFL